jgi:hypothetical protein
VGKTFDQGKEEVARLCQYFATNRQAFLAPGVKEAHVRQTLIDPFFEALGWDVRNAARAAPQYREVISEPSLDVEGQQKAPDYAFRVGTLTKFYAEAKKCGANIAEDSGPAYQLRRYGWSAKVALSVLTDFEEFGVYDCTLRPRPADKASYARIQYFRFDEYPDRWRELWDVFSREAVWSGQFDQYAASKRKRGTSEVDVEFLKEIEGWRDALARNIALRNADLSSEDLNAAVQSTIDRVVFLRMAEDRGLEPCDQLLKLCERDDLYPRFMSELCRKADEKYNSGLFHFQKEEGVSEAPDRITPKLSVDDKVFKPILQSLYFAHGSPYHFGVLPVEILGTVYERFLGKVIRLTAGHQAKVEDKPEVRKAGGVYYTPAYIVDYIVKQTVGRQIEGKSPAQLAGGKGKPPLRVLDMACGSGSFLLRAYQFLLDHCLKWYIEHSPETFKKAVYKAIRNDHWLLSIDEKKRILTTHVFGVDIDAQAVEVTKLSLLLKVLEGETDQSVSRQLRLFHDRALPNLAENIKCGNSLIAPDFYHNRQLDLLDPDRMHKVNAFDWQTQFPKAFKAGGYDAVIGNPPYVSIQTMNEAGPDEVSYFNSHYKAAGKGNYDIYVVFVERGLSLLADHGSLGFILPSKFFATDYGRPLRGILADRKALAEIVDFRHGQVFERATTYTCLLFLTREERSSVHYAVAEPPEAIRDGTPAGLQADSAALSDGPWVFSPPSHEALLSKLRENVTGLLSLPSKISRGSSTGNDDVFMLRTATRGYITRDGRRVEVEEGILRTPIYATDFGRYRFAPCSDERVIFPYVVSSEGYRELDEEELAHRYPKSYTYLKSRKLELVKRKQFKKWYGFSAPRNLDTHLHSHLMVPLLANMGLYCALPKSMQQYCPMASGGFTIAISEQQPLNPHYVMGLLNSKLLYWVLASISNRFRGGWVTCTKQYVGTLPIRRIDFSQKREKSRHDRIVEAVDLMLALHKHLASAKSAARKTIIQRQIDATDAEIDRLVYDLYGLTAEEIAIVEGATK